jgi:beta-galactosidase beta subunit
MKDIQLFSDAPDTWINVKEGMFALLFPTDAHAPLACKGQIHKAIFKVAVNW